MIYKKLFLLPVLAICFFSVVCFGSECFDNGEKFEKLGKKEGPMQGEYLQKAQDYFLCASKENNTLAGFKAAALSESGMAKKIDAQEVVQLYAASANDGNSTAALALASIYCGVDVFACSQPKNAKVWLIKSASLDNLDGINTLGYFYEKGFEGNKNLVKAAACYKLADDKGYELGKENYKRILPLIDSRELKTVKCL